jgi:DNA-binding NarL/FixJ family response regulator
MKTESLTKTVNVLLLDDHAMFREGLARTLERETDFKVVGQCGTPVEALGLLDKTVKMVLLDVDLGDSRALEFVEGAKKLAFDGKPFDAKILVVTAGISGPEAVRLIQAGVRGIVHKRQSGQMLCESIRKIAAGESCLEDQYLTSLMQSMDRTRGASHSKLTDRERALMRYILEGLTNREIGTHLHISEGAVKASLRLLFEKVTVRTRAQLVKVALEQYRDQL